MFYMSNLQYTNNLLFPDHVKSVQYLRLPNIKTTFNIYVFDQHRQYTFRLFDYVVKVKYMQFICSS